MGAASSNLGLLNDDDILRLKTSWAPVMENAEAHGIIIFKTFLERHNYYQYFKKFSGIPVNELADSRGFQKHSLSIMQTINGIITNMENQNKVRADLIDLGSFHRAQNVTEQQFKELKAVILEVLEKRFNLPVETLQAWNKAFEISYSHVMEGLKPKPTPQSKAQSGTSRQQSPHN